MERDPVMAEGLMSGLASAGKFLLFWATLGSVKLYNAVYSRVDPQEVLHAQPIDPNLARQEVEMFKQELQQWTKDMPTPAAA